MIPIAGRISGSLTLKNSDGPADAVELGRLDHLVGDVEQGGVDQHHRDADILPDRDQGQGGERVLLLAEPGREQPLQADRTQHRRRHAPDRAQDQLPGEADDHHRQHGRHEDGGAVEGPARQVRHRQDRRERHADRVLHQHVDHEEVEIVPERVPELAGPALVEEQHARSSARPTKNSGPPGVAVEERQPQASRPAAGSSPACRRSPPGPGTRRCARGTAAPARAAASAGAGSAGRPQRQARARLLGHGRDPSGCGGGGRPTAPAAGPGGHFCCGAYQAARPFWSWAAASSGVCVPLTTLAETTHISFHRLGVPRLMIW